MVEDGLVYFDGVQMLYCADDSNDLNMEYEVKKK